ncbi:MAG: hypothetical protein J1E98_11890 [Lachnospiraceae bacterium]|nr:hypothetical protein [Lachnospiraceae bacterium]
MLQTKTKNPGIVEAIREVRTMGLGRTLKALYDAHMKDIRDRNARDDYVKMEGRAEGEDKINRLILSLIQAGRQEDIEKAAKDKKYRDQLYKEYGIEETWIWAEVHEVHNIERINGLEKIWIFFVVKSQKAYLLFI